MSKDGREISFKLEWQNRWNPENAETKVQSIQEIIGKISTNP